MVMMAAARVEGSFERVLLLCDAAERWVGCWRCRVVWAAGAAMVVVLVVLMNVVWIDNWDSFC